MRKPEDGLDRTLQRDLEAFGRATGRGLPGWAETQREIRGLASRGARAGRLGTRRWPSRLAWLSGAAALTMVVLLFVPVTYATVAGQQVTLAIPWALAQDAQAEIVRGFRAVAKAEDVRVEVTPEGTRLTALVPDLSERRARENVEVFSLHIRSSGVEARVLVQPAMTTRQGTLYGLAADRLGRMLIDVRGRTNEEIEQDVRRRLEAIGFREADVKVERGGGRTDIKFRATDGQGRVEENEYRRELRGKAGGAPSAAEPPFELPMPDLSDLDNLPLGQRRDAIEKRLRDLGINARVTIENGRLRIDAVHDVDKRPNQK